MLTPRASTNSSPTSGSHSNNGPAGDHAVVGHDAEEQHETDREVQQSADGGRRRKDDPWKVDLRQRDSHSRRDCSPSSSASPRSTSREVERRNRRADTACRRSACFQALPNSSVKTTIVMQRLHDSPCDAERGLLVPHLYVAPRQEIEQLPVAPELAHCFHGLEILRVAPLRRKVSATARSVVASALPQHANPSAPSPHYS